MRAYEIMIILDGDLDEEAVAVSLSKVTANIESEGGRIASLLDSEPWRNSDYFRFQMKSCPESDKFFLINSKR